MKKVFHNPPVIVNELISQNRRLLIIIILMEGKHPYICFSVNSDFNAVYSIRLQLFSKCSFNPMSVIGYDVG